MSVDFCHFLSIHMKYLFYLLMLVLSYTPVCEAYKEELKIASFIEPPYTDLVDGKLVGENIQIAKLLAKSVGLKPTFIRCPFARCLSMVKHGQADMILGLMKLPEREKELLFLNPAYMVQHYPLRFFTLSTKKIVINSFDDLNKLLVGTLRGGNYFELFDNDKRITKIEITSREQLVQMLLRGRVDTFIDREESILPLLSPEEYKKITLADYQYAKPVKVYIAISQNSDVSTYAGRLSKQLNKFVTDGTITTIRTGQRN